MRVSFESWRSKLKERVPCLFAESFGGREILERGSARSRAEALRFDDFTP